MGRRVMTTILTHRDCRESPKSMRNTEGLKTSFEVEIIQFASSGLTAEKCIEVAFMNHINTKIIYS
jgi:hypothetical protein